VLMDRTAQLLARVWQASEGVFETLPEGGFVRLKGRTENYKGALQFIIEAIRPAEPGSFDLADFLPRTTKDVDQMWKEFTGVLQRIQHPDLRRLVDKFLADEKLMARFKIAPAAVNLHHAFLGGLLEHTLNLLELALVVIPRYPKLSLDLVLAGVFLHDIGKVAELDYQTSFGYTDSGQLLGHIVQAVLWIEQKCAAVAAETGKPFPHEVKWLVQHIVLSHHGEYEFGSPKLPAIPEAFAIHHLDNLDAKVTMSLAEIEKDRDPQARWTNYSKVLQTKVYKVDVMKTRGNAK